jgi:CBS domain-containing protein
MVAVDWVALSPIVKEFTDMARSIYDHKIADIMTREVVTLDAGGTVHEALALMGENRVSALPVVDRDQHCVGILSTTDLIDLTRDVDDDLYQLDLVDATSRRFLIDRLAHSLGNEKIDTFMSETLTTVTPESTLATAARKILKSGVHHLPVIDEQERLVGIVSSLDILREFADAAPQ